MLLCCAGFAIALMLGGGIYGILKFTKVLNSDRNDLIFHVVKKESLLVTIVDKGQLEAAENKDVICAVKASKGGQFSTTIKWVIDDGSHVNKDDKVVELDQSSLEDQKRTQQAAVDTAKALLVEKEANLEIVKSQNNTDKSFAETTLELALLDLKKYKEGEYPQLLDDVNGRIKKSESDRDLIKEHASWSERMVMKKYVSPSQSDAEQAKLMGAELDLKKLDTEKRVLTDFTKRRDETKKTNDVKEAERALERVEIQNKAKLNTALSDLKTKKALWEQEVDKMREIEDQIKVCILRAPQDGMVVYYVPEQSRMGGGAQQSIIAQGEPVREGQKLLRIPNLDHMLVNTKVHEAMVTKVKPGMHVDIKIDAIPDRVLNGKVKFVAAIAMQQDWRSSSDVKWYQAFISIVDSVDGLRPGMNALTITHVDASDGPVLCIPVQVIVGGAEMGSTRKVFVRKPDGQAEEREITLGIANEKMAEVKSGLVEGDQVVLNPKALLGDKAKTRNPADFEKNGNGMNGANGNGLKGEPKGEAPKGPGGPNGSPGGPAGGPGAGMPKWDPKMLQDPAVQKKMKEMGDPKTFDPNKMKGMGPPK